MEQIYRILIAEDTPSDVYLEEREIKKVFSKYELKVVETADDFLSVLTDFVPDIILSDYRMPVFDGLSALKITLEKSPLTPFILVTGSVNEETAVECMKAGATDYIIKEHIRRLGPAMLNAIEQRNIRLEKMNAEALLHDNEKMYRLMFEANPQPMWIYDMNTFEFLEVNQAAVKHYGYTREEFLKMTIKDIRPVEDIPYLLKSADKNSTNYSLSGEWRHLNKNGEILYVEIISQFVMFRGKPARHVLVNDITARKMAEKQIILLSRTIEQSPVSVMITDKEGDLVYVNPKFTEVTGYTFEEILGVNPRILMSGYHNPEFYRNIWDTILSGSKWSGEFQNKRKNGELYWDKSVISPLYDDQGEISNYIAVQEDITEFKNLYLEFLRAKTKAEESDKLKTAFLQTISHEIRTPVNAIVGFSEFFRNPGISEEKRSQFVDIIIKSSYQLLSIINDIVNMATIAAGQEIVEERKTNLNYICKLVFDQFQQMALEKNLTFNYTTGFITEEANILADEVKLMQILTNLVGNAIKFTLNGFVDFGYKMKDGNLEFFVKDSGIGIPEELHQNIFERFRQADYSHTRKFGGSGLGLTISKAYIEMQGGRIWLNSEPGKGSEFYFSIPYKPYQDMNLSTPIKEESLKQFNTDKVILVVEDEEFNYYLIEEMLNESGFTILHAENGQKAIEICEKRDDIDLIFMDLKMPIMNGFEATKKIREFYKTVPIIAQTAYTHDIDKIRALENGFNAYISKPFNMETFLNIIHHYLV